MFLLGLTGDIACGKSTVARWLVKRGAVHLDADLLVRELYRNREFARDLVTHLSQNAVACEDRVLDLRTHDGAVDRAALARWVLGDQSRLSALESFVHPAVARLRERKIDALRHVSRPPQVVVLEAVKLVESGQAHVCDALWWINCAPEVQMRRLTENRGLTPQEAALRLMHQPNEAAKRARLESLKIPFVFIENSGSADALHHQLKTLWLALPPRDA